MTEAELLLVIVEPIPKTGPNGDRDLQRHPYWDYKIHLAPKEGVLNHDTCVHEISGFDSFYTCIHNRAAVRSEVEQYAAKLARRLKTTVVWLGKDLKVYEISTHALILAGNKEEALEQYEARNVRPHVAEKKYD